MKRFLLLLSAAVFAQSGLDAPHIARILRDGRLLSLYGLAANVLVRDAANSESADAFAATAEGVWLIREGLLHFRSVEKQFERPLSTRQAWFTDSNAYFPELGLQVHPGIDGLETHSQDCPGEPAGIAPGGLLTRSEGRLTACGVPLASATEGRALVYAGRTIYYHDGLLTVRQPDGREEQAVLDAAPDLLAPAGADWIHLSASGQYYLLRIAPGKVSLSVIPQRSRP
jgi:hypothetical protein